MSIPATKLKERFGDSRKRRPNKLETKPSRLHRTLTDESAQNILDQVYDRYGRMSGPALSRLTHAAGTPWDHTYVPGSFGIVIPTDMIEDYYAQLGANSG